MKLHSRITGEGQPLIILHGLFGSSDNWQTLGKYFAEQGFQVHLVDQRNHGRSPHSDEWTYKAMSNDILEYIDDHQLKAPVLLGHSMGGKASMQFAADHPGILDKLIVADIAPRKYNSTQKDVAEALQRIDLDSVTSRKEAEEILDQGIDDTGTKQFLLKNLYWKEGERERLAWRFNLDVLAANIENGSEALEWNGKRSDVNALFLRGSRSNYIKDEDIPQIKEIFPSSKLITIEGAGHWLHAEKPQEFFKAVIDFIK
jgi:pimeloyl-ACP methyl ester carboxylesterase